MQTDNFAATQMTLSMGMIVVEQVTVQTTTLKLEIYQQTEKTNKAESFTPSSTSSSILNFLVNQQTANTSISQQDLNYFSNQQGSSSILQDLSSLLNNSQSFNSLINQIITSLNETDSIVNTTSLPSNSTISSKLTNNVTSSLVSTSTSSFSATATTAFTSTTTTTKPVSKNSSNSIINNKNDLILKLIMFISLIYVIYFN